MAGEKIPSNQPEKLRDILKQEKRDYDCTPCRIVGTLFPRLPFLLWPSLTNAVLLKQEVPRSSASLATATYPE
jgi:hypothetical protein